MREPPNYFILVAADVDLRRLSDPSAYSVAVHRLAIGKWGLRKRTRNRLLFKIGDKVLAYAAGKREYGVHIVGEAEVASEAKPIPKTLNSSIDSPSATSHVVSEYFLELEDGKVYPHPVDLRALKQQLAFIKNPETPKWAACLQNGCVRISEKDFRLIQRIGNSLK